MIFESIEATNEIRTINAKAFDENNIAIKIASIRLGINEAFKLSLDDTFSSFSEQLSEKGITNVTFHDGNGNLFS